MKKLMALMALTGLVAAGCATGDYRGGTYDDYDYDSGVYSDPGPNYRGGAIDSRDTEHDISYGRNAPNTRGPGVVPGGYGSNKIEPNDSSNSRP